MNTTRHSSSLQRFISCRQGNIATGQYPQYPNDSSAAANGGTYSSWIDQTWEKQIKYGYLIREESHFLPPPRRKHEFPDYGQIRQPIDPSTAACTPEDLAERPEPDGAQARHRPAKG